MIWFLAKPVILCMYHPPVLSVEGCEEETLNSTIQLFSHREAEAYPIKNGRTNVTFFRLPNNLPTCTLQSLFEHQGPASGMMISLAHSYFASTASRYPGWLGYLSPIYFTTLNPKSTPYMKSETLSTPDDSCPPRWVSSFPGLPVVWSSHSTLHCTLRTPKTLFCGDGVLISRSLLEEVCCLPCRHLDCLLEQTSFLLNVSDICPSHYHLYSRDEKRKRWRPSDILK